MKKRFFTVMVILFTLLLSSSLFADGAKEMKEDEKLVKVLSVTDGKIDVVDQSGLEIIYSTSEDTVSRIPIDAIKEGDILGIKDTGIMTLSIPAQSVAVEIRVLTPLYASGVKSIDFPPPETVQVPKPEETN